MPSNKKMIVQIVTILAVLLTFVIVVRAETQSLETLLAYLKSPNPSTRRDAAHKLGERCEPARQANSGFSAADLFHSTKAQILRNNPMVMSNLQAKQHYRTMLYC